jgi:hypothetical protein
MSNTRDRHPPLVMSTHRLVLHEHPFASFCQKALVALYELGVPFERRIVTDRRELTELWPLAKIPVLRDETAGLTLPSSPATPGRRAAFTL